MNLRMYKFDIKKFKAYIISKCNISIGSYQTKIICNSIEYVCKQHNDIGIQYNFSETEYKYLIHDISELFEMNITEVSQFFKAYNK